VFEVTFKGDTQAASQKERWRALHVRGELLIASTLFGD
jgi:hypothetical protein